MSYKTIKIQEPRPSMYPFWNNEPLSSETYIDPRLAGYKPYDQKISIKTVYPDTYDCAVYQPPCSTVYPVNKCYIKNPDDWIRTIFLSR